MKIDHSVQMKAGEIYRIGIVPPFRRAWVLAIKLEAPALEAVEVRGVSTAGSELMPLSPIPASAFNGAKSLALPPIWDRFGLQLAIATSTPQTVGVEVEFCECRLETRA